MRRIAVALAVLVTANVILVVVSFIFARDSERRHPPVGRLIESESGTAHVRDYGAPADDPDAPVLLLLHGASTSLLDFDDSLAPALRDTFRVVSLDRPGHGYSARGSTWPDPYEQAAFARGALEALAIEDAIWLGHSWAGAVVLAGLLEESTHARAGILLAGATHPWDGGSAWHAEFAARPVLGRIFTWQYIEPVGRLLIDDAIASVFAPEPVPDGYVDRTGIELSLRPETYRANAQDLTELSAHLEHQSERYPTLQQPILSITGTADEVVPGWNHDARLVAQQPSVTSVALPGAGHALHHTRPERVVELVTDFVESLAD